MSFALTVPNDRSLGFLASCAAHGALLFLGGIVLNSPIQYGVESGLGGVEVDLVAGLPEEIPAKSVVVHEALPVEMEEALQPEPTVLKDSHISGKDPVTFHASGGAMTDARPNYLRNPAPLYPIEARRNGWEGVVVLNVSVSSDGTVGRFAVKQSSGHEILDRTAVEAVKKWRFLAAKIGGIPVESEALVPVRFSLRD